MGLKFFARNFFYLIKNNIKSFEKRLSSPTRPTSLYSFPDHVSKNQSPHLISPFKIGRKTYQLFKTRSCLVYKLSLHFLLYLLLKRIIFSTIEKFVKIKFTEQDCEHSYCLYMYVFDQIHVSLLIWQRNNLLRCGHTMRFFKSYFPSDFLMRFTLDKNRTMWPS